MSTLGYEYTPTSGSGNANGSKEGGLCYKGPADFFAWQCSMRGYGVWGSAHNHPIRLRNTGDAIASSILGLQVPVIIPAVTVADTGGFIDGKIQIAIQKYNSKRQTPQSDISPVYPPPALQIDAKITPVDDDDYYQVKNVASPNNYKSIGQQFTVIDTLSGISLTGGEQTFREVQVKIRIAAAQTTGKIKVALASNKIDMSGEFPATGQTYVSEPVNLSELPLASVAWADVEPTKFFFPGEAILVTGSKYWVLLQMQDFPSGAEVEWCWQDAPPSPIVAGGSAYEDTANVWHSFPLASPPTPPPNSTPATAHFWLSIIPGGDARSHANYLNLSAGTITVTNLADYYKDIGYEDFDSLRLLIREAVQLSGAFVPAVTVPADNATVTFDQEIAVLVNRVAIAVIPYTNRPWGGMEQTIAIEIGSSPPEQRLVGVGRCGFDNWTNNNIITAAGLLGMSVYNHDPKKWTLSVQGADPDDFHLIDKYVITAYQAKNDQVQTLLDGREIPLRGDQIWTGVVEYVAPSGLRVVNTKGAPFPFSNAGVETEMVRIAIRRRVLAKVIRGSDLVVLTYADDDTGNATDGWNGDGSPAYVADLWMLNSTLSVGSLGLTDIMRIEQRDPLPAAVVPYPGRRHFPSNRIYLEIAWQGESGVDDFSVLPDHKTIWFGGGRADNWAGTSPKLAFKDLPTVAPFVGVAWGQNAMIVVTRQRNLLVLQIGTIVDPSTITEAVAFDVGSAISTTIQRFNIAATSPSSFVTDQFANLYFSGPFGRFRTSLQQAEALLADGQSKTAPFLDSATLATEAAAIDQEHAFTPVIRFGGTGLQNDYRQRDQRTDVYFDPTTNVSTDVTWHMARIRRNIQFVFFDSRGTWVRFVNYGDIDAMTQARMSDGTIRMATLAMGRVGLYGSPARRGGQQRRDVYTILRPNGIVVNLSAFPAARIQSIASGDDVDAIVFLKSTLGTPNLSGNMWMNQAGLLVYKINADGTWERAELLFMTDNPTGFNTDYVAYLVKPLDTWTWTADATYTVCIGLREWKIELPDVVPGPKGHTVTSEELRIQMEDAPPDPDNAFNWPFIMETGVGQGHPTIRTLTRKSFTRSDEQNLRWNRLIVTPASFKFSRKFWGLCPPDSHIYLKSVEIGYREE